MSSGLLEWLARAHVEFSESDELDLNNKNIRDLIIFVGSKILDLSSKSSNEAYLLICSKLIDHFGELITESLKSSDIILSEGILVYSVSEDCIWREKCVNIILGLDREVQIELMTTIQLGMSTYLMENESNENKDTNNNNNNTTNSNSNAISNDRSSVLSISSQLLNKNYSFPLISTSSVIPCLECEEKEETINDLKIKLHQSEWKCNEIESKLKSSVSIESHKLIDAELQIIEKERLITTLNIELDGIKQKLNEYDKKSLDYEKINIQLQNLQDRIEILQPQAQRAEEYELQLEKVKDKLDEYKGMKHQYQHETLAHSETYEKLLQVQLELEVMKKYQHQVDEYRQQVTELTIEVQECKLRLSSRDHELITLQSAYTMICNEYNVNLQERVKLSQDLNATNEILRQNNQPTSGLGNGVNEFNPVLMQEITTLRSENHELRSQLDQTSVETLEKLTKELMDQSSMNNSLTKKLMDTKDQLSIALMKINQVEKEYTRICSEFQYYRLQQEEMTLMIEEDIQARKNRYCKILQQQEQYHNDKYYLLTIGKDSIIQSYVTNLQLMTNSYTCCSNQLEEVIEIKNTLESNLSNTCTELENICHKRKCENDEYCHELNRMKEEFQERCHQLSLESENNLKLQELSYQSNIEKYEERLRLLQVDMDEEKTKRRRIEREKRVLESDVHRYKTQAQTNTSLSGNIENIDIVMKEFNLMRQELDNARSENMLLRSNNQLNSTLNVNVNTSASASSDSNLNQIQIIHDVPKGQSNKAFTRSKSSRPVRMLVQSESDLSSSLSSSSSSLPISSSSLSSSSSSYDNFIDIAEMNNKKLEILSREKRELLAKNLESDKEKAEMNQRILQNEKEIEMLKVKIIKITIEKERMERKLDNMTA